MLNDEQRRLFDLLEQEGLTCFVTGSAGTGKSTLLRYLVRSTRKQVMVVAPTGIAALNVEGETIHGAFRLPIHLVDDEWIQVNTRRTDGLGLFEALRNVELLAIDEASMVSSVLLDLIDARLRYVRKDDHPFGGVQTVLFGDLLQLPAFASDDAVREYVQAELGGLGFFRSNVWRSEEFPTFSLTKVMRQNDSHEVELLDRARMGQSNSEDLYEFNERVIGEGVP